MIETEQKQFLLQGDMYEVEKLVGAKIVKGKKLYKVRWRGYGPNSDTLEPEENLFSCKDMIKELEDKITSRVEKKKNKKIFKTHSVDECNNLLMSDTTASGNEFSDTTWQAKEVHQGINLKDTFWRDFDEGKINVFDQDMYSKVKERASRTVSVTENGKPIEVGQKEYVALPPLCPKVVLKRKPTSRNPCGYKSSLKVKSLSVHIRKRKKYDVLRDYRKRKSRIHRKRKTDENLRRRKAFLCAEKASSEIQAGSNILQELLINDEQKQIAVPPEYSFSCSKLESKEVHSNGPKESSCSERVKTEVKKNQSLTCRITIHDKSKGIYGSTLKHTSKQTVDSSVSLKSSRPNADAIRKVFMSLLQAATNEQIDKVERLCASKHVVNCCREDGTTALMVASQLGFCSVVKVLLKANAHKDKQNKNGETALMLACRNGQSKIAKLLLEHGANFALTNSEGINALRITNKFASKTVLHGILIEHIMKMVSEFETQARSVVEHIAEIKYALFPIQCFSLNEGPRFAINFHHHVKLESPGKSGKQNLLFIARSTIKSSNIKCLFTDDSLATTVTINEVKQTLFHTNDTSVFKMAGLRNGNNKVTISTAYYPESEVKLVVCAYRVHKSIAGFPSQKLKNEFLD